MKKSKIMLALLLSALLALNTLGALAEEVSLSDADLPVEAALSNDASLLAEAAPVDEAAAELGDIPLGGDAAQPRGEGSQILELPGEGVPNADAQSAITPAGDAPAAEGESSPAADAPASEGDPTSAGDAPASEGDPATGEEGGTDAPVEDDPAAGEEGAETPAEPEPIAPTGLTGTTALVIGAGEKVQLDVAAEPEGAVCALTYRTSNSKFVAVNGSGLILGRRAGKSATITVTADSGHTLSIRVKVLAAPRKAAIKASRTTLGVGESLQLISGVNKNSASYARTYYVDGSGTLSVTQDGVLTAEKPGKGAVAVRTFNNKRAGVKITVLPAPDHLVPDPAETTLTAGFSTSFKASLPQGTAGEIHYESLDSDVAQVDAATGRITGLAEGVARIRGIAFNGVSAECVVQVLPAPSGIAFEESSMKLLVGQVWAPDPAIAPENAYRALTLKSSQPKVVKVVGDTVCALAKGTAVITATTCNKLTASITVTVPAAPTGISMSPECLNLSSGETTQLNYALRGGGETEYAFTSLQPDIASVDPVTGEVTALSTGTAIVQVATLNGLKASCLVNVDADADLMSLVNGSLKVTFMNVGRNDGILLECGGEYAYIDSGRAPQGVTAVKYMRNRGVTRLKYYIGTHGHKDHVGGAPIILALIPTDIVIVPHARVASQIKRFGENAASRRAAYAAQYHVMRVGERFYLGGARFEMLGPRRIVNVSPGADGENVNSLILKGFYGQNTYLFTGDAMGSEFVQIQNANPGALRSDVFKNPHHYGTQTYAAKLASPSITIFSTDNKYQPAGGYVNWLKRRGSQVYITSSNRHSHVTVSSDGTNLSVSTARTPK